MPRWRTLPGQIVAQGQAVISLFGGGDAWPLEEGRAVPLPAWPSNFAGCTGVSWRRQHVAGAALTWSLTLGGCTGHRIVVFLLPNLGNEVHGQPSHWLGIHRAATSQYLGEQGKRSTAAAAQWQTGSVSAGGLGVASREPASCGARAAEDVAYQSARGATGQTTGCPTGCAGAAIRPATPHGQRPRAARSCGATQIGAYARSWRVWRQYVGPASSCAGVEPD